MTSIEWLIEQIKEYDFTPPSNNEEYVIVMPKWIFDSKKDEALKQEKQDIITAYAFGHNDGCRYMTNEKQEFEHGEAYFAETFKQDL
jgi:hypothetical protein